MKSTFLAPVLALCLMASGCSTLESFAAGTATSLSSSSPSQVTTLADADLAADLIVKVTKLAVDSGKLDEGTLVEIQALRGGVRVALDRLHAANTAGQSLSFASFNASLEAYRAYATLKGVAQ